MTENSIIQKNVLFVSIIAIVALLLFTGAASAFTVTQEATSTPSGNLTSGQEVSSSMRIVYYNGEMNVGGFLELKTDLVGQSWTVDVYKGSIKVTELHPSYASGYTLSGFDLSGYATDIELAIKVEGTVSYESEGKAISAIKLIESGTSGNGLKSYSSPKQYVSSPYKTATPTTGIPTATVTATAVPTSVLTEPIVATVLPTPVAIKTLPTPSVSASKHTLDSTALIIIISALVVIIAGTVIIVRLTKRSKKTQQTANTTVEQKEIHVHVNGNLYSDVGVVASDNAIVNRPIVTNETVKKCPYCGAEIKNDDKFCGKCGKQL